MTINNQDNAGGGPWSSRGGGNQSPWGQQKPPDLEDLLKKGRENFRRFTSGGGFKGGSWLYALGFAVLLIWLSTGFYRLVEGEQGAILRFGKLANISLPGLRYHLPYPIETVLKVNTTTVRRIDSGVRNNLSSGRQTAEEGAMLTGDENIVEINNFTVYWLINDIGKFLFNARDPDTIIRAAAESAIREIIAQTPLALALAEGRGNINIKAQELLQSMVDHYQLGVAIRQVLLQKVDPPAPVIDAFRDVQRARADQERLRNKAEAYRNDILPRAAGKAERLVQEATAYRQSMVSKAEGEAQRFLSILEQYQKAPEVTINRLYIETMQHVLQKMKKVIIDQGNSNAVVPYLPLPEIKAKAQEGKGTSHE